jgi:hypothetical protein
MVTNPSEPQRIDASRDATDTTDDRSSLPSIVRNLDVLVEQGASYPTIYADPPWPYSNTAARGAAENLP